MIPVRPARPVLRERSDRLLQFLTGQEEFWNYSVDSFDLFMKIRNTLHFSDEIQEFCSDNYKIKKKINFTVVI